MGSVLGHLIVANSLRPFWDDRRIWWRSFGEGEESTLKCSGDLVSRLSKSSFGVCYGLFLWLVGDTERT